MRNNWTSARSALSPIPWPEGAWNPWLVFAAAVCWIVLSFGPLIAYLIFYNVAHHVPHDGRPVVPPTSEIVVAQLLAYVPVVPYLLFVLPALSHVSLAELGIRRPTARDLGVGLVGTVAMWLVVVVASEAIAAVSHRHDTETAVSMLKDLKSPGAIALFFVLACVAAPIVEELTFRVFVFGALTRYAPIPVAAVLSGALFGFVHASKPWELVTVSIPLALGGVVLALVYATSRCFWSNVTTHACFNAINVVALVFFHAS